MGRPAPSGLVAMRFTRNTPLLVLAGVLFTPSGAFAQTTVPSGNLVGSQSWTAAGSPYLITGDLTVPAGTTLTLEAGTVIHLGTGDNQASGIDAARTELRIAGALVVNGTANARVLIRSGAASPSTGDFYGVVLLAGASANLNYLDVERGHRCILDQSTGATLTNLRMRSCGYGLEVQGGSPTITASELSSATSWGLYAHTGANVTASGLRVEANSSHGVHTLNAALNLSGSLVRNNGGYGVYLRATAAGTYATVVQHNTIYGNSNSGLFVTRSTGTLNSTVRSNLIVANTSTGISSSGTVNYTLSHNLVFGQATNYSGVAGGTGAVTENPLLVNPAMGDYRPTSRSGARMAAHDGTDIGAFPFDGAPTPNLVGHLFTSTVLTAAASPHLVVGDLVVRPGVTLTVEPGAVVRFSASSDALGAGNEVARAELRVQGTLVADGTASLPVRFESAAPTPARGDWYGIHLEPGSTSSIIDNAIIRHARYGVRTQAPAGTSVTRSTIEESLTNGYFADGGATVASELLVRNTSSHAVRFLNASGEFTRSVVVDNNGYGIYVQATAAGTHNVVLTRNTVTQNVTYGIFITRSTGTLITTVRDNLVVGSTGTGIGVSGTVSLTVSHNLVWGHSTNYSGVAGGTGAVTENPLLVNLAARDLRPTSHSPARRSASHGGDIGALAYDGVLTTGVQGWIHDDTTWSGTVDVLGDVTVRPGATLTILAGTTVRFVASSDSMGGNTDVNRSELIVLGRLVADGTPQSRITFTSAAATPSAGDWYGIRLTSTAANSTIDDALITHARYGVWSQAPASTVVTRTEIRNSQTHGIYADGGAVTFDGLRVHSGNSHAVSFLNASGFLHNLLVYGNSGYGVWIRATAAGTHSVELNHLTVSGNTTYGVFFNRSTGTLVASLRNSIIASNTGTGVGVSGTVSLTQGNNNVWGQTTNYSGVTAGAGSISASPGFVDPSLQNFYLLPSSTSIDAASLTTALPHDIEGTLRPLDGNNTGTALPDMGAFEYNPSSNRWPIADAGPSRVVTRGLPATFDGSGSFDPDGTIVSWAWDFGDGNTGSGPMVIHTFTTGGQRQVTLTVTDNQGAIGVARVNVLVNIPPTANAGPPRFADPGESVTFNGSGSADSDGSIVSYSWNFGDGAQGSGVQATHSYSSGGTYTVTLTVTDNHGATGVATTTANVTGADGAPPVIVHAPVTSAQTSGQPVTINADVTDSSGVGTVSLFYRTSGQAMFASMPMSLVSGSTYRAVIPGAAVTAPGVEYYIRATDQAPSANAGTHPPGAPGSVHSFPVTAPAGPVITHTPVPAGQVAGSPVQVSATITAGAGLASAVLNYRPQGGGAFTQVPMMAMGNDLYRASIPGAAVQPPQVEYFIEATDTQQRRVTEPGSGVYGFTVTRVDAAPPAIVHTPIAPGQQESVPVQITATITDPSGVASASLAYRVSGSGMFTTVPMQRTSGDVFAAEIPSAAVTSAGVDYYLSATDGASPANTGADPAGAPASFHSFTVGRPLDVQEGDLIVSEVMYDPTGPDSQGEWFEIFNTTTRALDIEGLTFRDDDGDSFTVRSGGPLTVPPSGYLVLGRNGDRQTNGGVAVDYVYSGFILANSADQIVIGAGSLVIDRFAYDTRAGFPRVTGRSIQLDVARLDDQANDDPVHWCPSTTRLPGGDYGTPGGPNHGCGPEHDRDPPILVHTPIGGGQPAGLAVPVVALVSDRSGLSAVRVHYRAPGAPAFATAELTSTGGDVYRGDIPADAVEEPGLEYWLEAVDQASTPNTAALPAGAPGAVLAFDVAAEDRSGPSITHRPIESGVTRGAAIPVRAVVVDVSGVMAVRVHYRPAGGAWSEAAMTARGGGVYEAQIPGVAVTGASVEYYLSAEDGAPAANTSALPALGASGPFVVGVGRMDDTGPVIVHTPIASGVPVGAAVTVEATISDPSGVAEALLYYRRTGDAAFTALTMQAGAAGRYSAEIPGAAVTDRGVEYYLEAIDDSEDENLTRDPARAPAEVHRFTAAGDGGEDTEAPSIVHVPVRDGQRAGSPVTVLAEITDASGVASARVFFRRVGDSAFIEVPMVQNPGTNRFEATLPGAEIASPGVEYYLTAVDASAGALRSYDPALAPADVYAFTVSSGGLDRDPEGGCSCSASEEQRGPGWALLLVLAPLLARRRISRRR